MSLFNRLLGPQPNAARKASDEALLMMSMFLMVGADGSIEQEEMATVQSYFNTLPDFRGKDFQKLLLEANKVLNRFGGNSKNAVNALADIENPSVKMKCFVLAADIAMSSGDVDAAEEQLLEAMQRILNVQDDIARKILEVLQLKYAC